jgi:hypothetical protein
MATIRTIHIQSENEIIVVPSGGSIKAWRAIRARVQSQVHAIRQIAQERFESMQVHSEALKDGIPPSFGPRERFDGNPNEFDGEDSTEWAFSPYDDDSWSRDYPTGI